LKLDPSLLLSADQKRIDFSCLELLAGESIISARQFDRRTVIELCKFAALLELTEIAAHHPLDGKLVITAFFEASTRTRLSFESAVLRLDGKIVSVPDGRVTGLAKGESLEDIGEMFNTYGDLVVLRHPDTDSVQRIRKNLQLPLVSAGHGSGEHPTQALLDWYTILKWRPALALPEPPEHQKVRLGIIGTPGSMRAVKSFLLLALAFPNALRGISVVSEMVDPLGDLLANAVRESPIPLDHTNDLNDVVEDLDIVYMNSIAFLGESYRTLDNRHKLTRTTRLKEGAVIMHPFARRGELATDLDDAPHNLYFAQAASAVFLRQALLIALLGRVPSLPPSIRLLTT
jgi:aspartate carbamoyltransferase catalytic subunit